ncbi:odorant receptor 94a-like [Zeugodacus cucurbitae]|uniref:odorant receptor 94a-like n=1 Tax=Zeugodacus cucurbitae TaxID=28588 RepID=UPI0023D91B48|nr:odorant receptor 94a-like [Zeugodacus cucurbitae]
MTADECSSSMSRTYGARYLVVTLKAIGLWQWTGNSSHLGNTGIPFLLKLQRAHGLILHVPISFTFITLMFTAVLLSHDLEEISSVFHILLTEFSLVVKILHIWRQGSAAWHYMDELAHEPMYALRRQCEWTKWQRAQRSFAIIAYSYILGSLAVVVFGCIGVMLTPADVYVLPFNYYVPFEWRHPRKYWYAWAYSSLGILLTCISNITLDMIYCYFMFHLSLLYKLIGWRLTALRRPKSMGYVDVGAQDVTKQMIEIFQMHMKVKRLTTQCETLVSVPVLAQIILSAFILCFSGYRLQHMKNMENVGILISTIQFASVMILQIFLPCYYGNAVTEYSNALTNDIFNSDWTTFDVPARKFMILYMELLKRPATLKAANFFNIGLPVFAKTMNNAYSIFALLLNMNK